MSCTAGPAPINSSLLIALDPANTKSYDYRPGTQDHGISEWYCFITATVTYSLMENISLFQVTGAGVTSTLVSSSSSPQRGTFSALPGYLYYGNGPIFLVAEDAHHAIAPVTMNSTQFGHYVVDRASPGYTVYMYSPYATSTVNFFENTSISGVAINTATISKGQSATFTSINSNTWFFISSNAPIVASVAQNVWDKTILSPAQPTIYNRYIGNYSTVQYTSPTVSGSYVVYSTTTNVVANTTADGSGGDAAQGLGTNYLCNSYSFGNSLSDYVIAAPYENTVVSVYYWSTSSWVLLEQHSLTGGTLLSPAGVARDGTTGVGIVGTLTNGTAAFFASGANHWKWVGNNPFYLGINDTADDELSMLGWSSTRTTRTVNNSDNTWSDISPNDYTGTIFGAPGFNTAFNGIYTFNTSSQYITLPNTNYPSQWTDGVSIAAWIYVPSGSTWTNGFIGNIISRGNYDGTQGLGQNTTNNQIIAYFRGLQVGGTPSVVSAVGTITRDTWNYCVAIWDGSATNLYINGTLAQRVAGTLLETPESASWNIAGITAFGGAEGNSFTGNLSLVQIYRKALTSDEVFQNFNAQRSRFGL